MKLSEKDIKPDEECYNFDGERLCNDAGDGGSGGSGGEIVADIDLSNYDTLEGEFNSGSSGGGDGGTGSTLYADGEVIIDVGGGGGGGDANDGSDGGSGGSGGSGPNVSGGSGGSSGDSFEDGSDGSTGDTYYKQSDVINVEEGTSGNAEIILFE